MVKMLSRTLGDNITLKVDTPPDLWPIVADQAQLASAILHLAVNARDAMPSGGQLTITAANVGVDDSMRAKSPELMHERYVCLSVTDTGTGMTPEVIAHVFEPFFTTKRDRKGSGLGLPQVLGFAKQSGGTARIYSEVGHGTSVHLYLPAAGADDEIASSEAMPATVAPGRGETLLVVEDNPELLDAVVEQLNSLGYRYLVASNGQEALAVLAKGERIDLLFTDVVMPGGMDGRQLAAAVQSKWPGLKILFTSGFAGASAADGGALPGRLLRKPYRMQDLALRVRETLDS
jgi:CheY-like chemotaxis protein